ncbi:MAG: selenium-dependent molybdenum cofactor biosynthesis protein YqeB [Lachnospiraceae bacterium]|nr:selenium-dependent molybdenum cofactor biosynthesis protein YqeB [Lachnospiraceae bacterium]
MTKRDPLIIVRGGGDIATGTIAKLYQSGFRVLILEIDNPSAIRRKVSFCDAVFDKKAVVEDMTCVLVEDEAGMNQAWQQGLIPLMIDGKGEMIKKLKPAAVIDAILAKKNLGTNREMAPVTIGLGPGFSAPEDVCAVIETKRGHRLGRVIYQGSAIANTGIPGVIAGYGKERVIHAPATGRIENKHEIGDLVEEGEIIAMIGDTPVKASLTGVLRGIIKDGYPVKKGLKIADIDPRKEEQKNCFTISDKARCVGGGALEALLHLLD